MQANRMIALLLGGTILSVATPAWSQDAAEQAAEESGLQAIIVTANRRAENSQDVPIAVSAVQADVAQKLGVMDISSLTNIVPGFTFNRQAAGSQPYIRGVGNQSTTIGNEPSVGLFLDDVYIPTSNSAQFEFNSISSVEVLKGPQGTLFGRNSTGGIVHVHTKDPTFERSADMEVGYATYETVTAKAYVNVPLGESVAANVAAYRTYQGEGWGRDVYTGRDVFLGQAWGARGKLLFNLGEQTSLLVSGGYNYQKGSVGQALRTVMGFAGRSRLTPEQQGAGFYDSTTGQGDFYEARFAMGSAKLTHDFGPVQLTSITAYTDSKNPNFYDISANRGNLLADFTQTENAFTQEVHLASPDEAKVKWIVGAFYLKDTAVFDGAFTGTGPAAGTSVVSGVPNLGPAVPAGRYSSSHARQKTESISAFAQSTVPVTDALNVTVGLRYTSDKRAIDRNGGELGVIGGPVLAASGPFPDSKRFNKLTWRLAADYHVTEDAMIYAAYNRGFKSGVYGTSSYNVASRAVVAAVLPETIDAYSAGFKSELWDHRVRFNVEGFYYKIKNMQLQNNLVNQAGAEIRNSGRASLKGVEAELTVEPVNRLIITGSISVVDGKYDEFNNGPTYFPQAPNARIPIPAGCAGNTAIYPVPGGPAVYPSNPGVSLAAVPSGCNLAGNKMLQVIPFSSQLSATYTIPFGKNSVDIGANWLHTDPYFFEPDNSFLTRQVAVDVINASLAFNFAEEAAKIRFWVNNLTDKEYYSYIAHSATSGTKGAPAAPRTYGITLMGQF